MKHTRILKSLSMLLNLLCTSVSRVGNMIFFYTTDMNLYVDKRALVVTYGDMTHEPSIP